jgi:hypothetical protein
LTGNAVHRDEIAAEAAVRYANCDVIALAQFNSPSVAPLVAGCTGKIVLTTPDSALTLLNRRIAVAG